MTRKRMLFPMILAIVLFCWLVAAEDSTFYYQKDSIIDLTVPCVTENGTCSNIASCNISINYENGTRYIKDVNMTNQNSYMNYTMRNTSIIGKYSVIVFCNQDTLFGYQSFFITINNSGSAEPISGLMIAVIIIILILFLGTLMWGLSIEGSNKWGMGAKGETLIEINYGYYAKLLLYSISYLLFWVFTWVVWNTMDKYSLYTTLTGIIRYAFIVESILILPLMIIVVVIGFVKHLTDSEELKLVRRNLMPR